MHIYIYMYIEILPEGSLTRVLNEVAEIAINFTPQGLSNSLHGLARMGVLWDDLPIQVSSIYILTHVYECVLSKPYDSKKHFVLN
jgi:hypothetical protein